MKEFIQKDKSLVDVFSNLLPVFMSLRFFGRKKKKPEIKLCYLCPRRSHHKKYRHQDSSLIWRQFGNS